MTAAAAGAWACVFKEQEVVEGDDTSTSDTTSQSLESRHPKIQSSEGDDTEETEASSENGRRRATLSKEQAAVIYVLRPWQKENPYPKHPASGNAQMLSKWFGVTPKAVRDVWSRRTWAHATGEHAPASVLDALPKMLEQLEQEARSGVVVRRPTRPIGSKEMNLRRSVAMKVPYNMVLENRVTETGMQPGMSREAVHAAMFPMLKAEQHIPAIMPMAAHGGSHSDPSTGAAHGGSHSDPSTGSDESSHPRLSPEGDTLDYLSGKRLNAASSGSTSRTARGT
ncbi:hypothetical protein T484DRAFT_1824745 [Baffinella frigidus]|nr:hypothetical protein T484DRAFT_1824745 [Cryptophyta sp. CCMP2293]